MSQSIYRTSGRATKGLDQLSKARRNKIRATQFKKPIKNIWAAVGLKQTLAPVKRSRRKVTLPKVSILETKE